MSKKKDQKIESEQTANVFDEVTASVLPSLSEYRARFEKAVLRTDKKFQDDLNFLIGKIQKNKSEYEKVEAATKVPWYFVAGLHSLESGLDFSTWLANGDPLSAPTRQVPAGLKLTPNSPHSAWVNGAIVSLEHEGFDALHFDTIEECLAAAELYNGTGYLTGKQGQNTTPKRTSPYLWSGTDQYVKGKYVADGEFDPEAVSQQIGMVPLLKKLVASEKPAPVLKKATWFEIFRTAESNAVVGYEGSQPIVKINTNEVRALIEVMQKNPGANTFRVAPVGKEVPELGSDIKPEPKPTGKSSLRLSKDKQSPRADGFVQLNLRVLSAAGESVGNFKVVSGMPGKQNFNVGDDSIPQSLEPLPEGKYSVGMIEWADGKDSYSASHGTGLGPIWLALEPQFRTRRGAIGIHRDDNVEGTAGCVGLFDTADCRRFVDLMRKYDPLFLYADWGLGTCPQE